MTTVKLAFELLLIHSLPSHHQNVLTVGSRFECAFQCMYDLSCVSLVYHVVSGSCYLYYDVISANTVGTTDEEFLMYNTDRGKRTEMETTTERPCLTAVGYVLNEALDLCYKIHSEGKSNSDADAACKAEGGTELVRVDTEGKLQLFLGLIPQYQYTHISGYLVDGNWVYPAETSPQTTPYLQWSPGQPNGGSSNNQDCLAMDSTGVSDSFCTHSAYFPFICQM